MNEALNSPVRGVTTNSAPGRVDKNDAGTGKRSAVARVWEQLRQNQPWLTRYSELLIAVVPMMLLAMALDERQFRGVSIWLKPLKFVLSTIMFSLTTAWFVGYLPSAVRGARAVRWIVITVIATSLFEVLYIGFQAGIGSASHYNVADRLHATLFVLMAIAAIGLTGTQAALAVLIRRHSPRTEAALTAVIALWLTFILATVSGMMLGGAQPPAGSGVPVLGWHLSGGDIRPAHFLGVHAHQIIPLAGWGITRLMPSHIRPLVLLFVALYLVSWLMLTLQSFPAAR